MICHIPKKDIDFVWKDCKPFLEKALDDTYNIDDVYTNLQKDLFQLWISWQGGVECAVVTEMAQYPQKKILRYFLAGGKNLGQWLTEIQERIEKFAKRNGCDAVEVAGRKGWIKKLKGYSSPVFIIRKEI